MVLEPLIPFANGYFNSIDGLGAEDFFFKGEGEEDNPFVDSLGTNDPRIADFKFTAQAYLDLAAHNIPIFNVEYLSNENTVGLQQYCGVLSDQFSFSNPGITTEDEAPGLTNSELQGITFIPFQAPSRDLNQLSALKCGPGPKLYFPQFGNGGGFISDLVLINPSATLMTSGQVDILDDDGQPLQVGIAGESGDEARPAIADASSQVSSVQFSVPARGAVTVSTDGQGDVVVGSAVVTPDSTLGGVVRFELPGIGIAGVGASPSLSRFIVPVRRESGGINTGIALYNTESIAVTLDLTLRDQQGQTLSNGTRTIVDFPAGGHLARFINEAELFPGADTDGFEGTLVVEVTGGKIAATALELGPEPGQFTTLPVTPLQ